MAVVIERRLVYRCPSYAVCVWLAVCFALGGLACVFMARPASMGNRVQTRTVHAQDVSVISDAETIIEGGYATARLRLLHWASENVQVTLTLFRPDDSVACVETITLAKSEVELNGGWVTVSARTASDSVRALVTIAHARSSSPHR
jgi:hypothetical protein